MAISKKVVNDTISFINNIFSNNSEIDLPVEIENIVKVLKIDLVYYTFEEEISGVLVLNGSHSTIGVNQGHSGVRKRFTIAHELGHYILHKDQGSMFMDKVLYRKNSDDYNVKDEKLEREANYFAANLLMPEKAVRKLFAKSKNDFYDDSNIQDLAEKFEVSNSAMTYRLVNLGLIEF
ncbi:ImmA/IrrE family metallo-endopeptidase [Sphingobacterium sp. SGG-5]|uniref:ImmA/IrrE family metallo-endopeptidase n=1 Tax=Sphingobacterium sp. SGG-5 TaxID=2710881 RepID=UPI0013EA0559|nr:ImmA/IrrE family metallo-endopeptidase [Sphingobacterium sp. SGG-5]NGM62691.1 ImmA/IrrE family metallo-endopeptidase [Sphingobacterium sp. SGG-5]